MNQNPNKAQGQNQINNSFISNVNNSSMISIERERECGREKSANSNSLMSIYIKIKKLKIKQTKY